MSGRLLTQALAAILFIAADYASAQTTSADILDSRKPPAGFVAPKPAEARDLSMAKYARESFLTGEEGVVALRVLVRRDGSVGDSQIADSSGSPALDRYARDLVKDWRYQPATVDGTPVDTWIAVNIVWALQTLRFNLSLEQVKNMSTYYPALSVSRHEVGGTTVRFLVAPDGTIAKVLVDRSSGYQRLDDATVRMVKSGFRFSPAMLKTGETVGAWFRLEVDWALGSAVEKPD